MNIIATILIGLGVIIIGLVAFMAIKLMLSSRPTTGKKIESYANPQKALLVIDIQEDYTGTTGKSLHPAQNAETLVQKVNKIIDAASGKNFIVVYISHEFDNTAFYRLITGGRSIKGTPGAEIDKRIKRATTYLFTKNKSDSFSNPRLETFLIEQRVDEVFLVGLDAVYCVYNTAKGALNRDYKVTIIKDAVITISKKTWDEIDTMYQNAGISTQTSEEFTGS